MGTPRCAVSGRMTSSAMIPGTKNATNHANSIVFRSANATWGSFRTTSPTSGRIMETGNATNAAAMAGMLRSVPSASSPPLASARSSHRRARSVVPRQNSGSSRTTATQTTAIVTTNKRAIGAGIHNVQSEPTINPSASPKSTRPIQPLLDLQLRR